MTDMKPNIERLEKVLGIITELAALIDSEFVRAYGEGRLWVQADWRCSTGMCFAGHAADLYGAEWVTQNNTTDGRELVFVPAEMVAAYPGMVVDNTVLRDSLRVPAKYLHLMPPVAYVSAYAHAILGLGDPSNTHDTLTHRLYDSNNEISDISRMIDEMKEDHEEAMWS